MADRTQLTADWKKSQQIGQTVQQMGQTVLKIGQNKAQPICLSILMGNLSKFLTFALRRTIAGWKNSGLRQFFSCGALAMAGGPTRV